MDDMIFFHEGTVRICGSLDLKEALGDCFVYLKRHIPLELVDLSIFDPEIGGIRVLARHADFDVAHDISAPVRLSRAAIDYIQSGTGKIVRIDSANLSAPSREMAAALGISDFTGIGMTLGIGGAALGFVGAVARGRRRFTEKHARLMSLLHDPFAIAMSNHLRYREVLRLQELLADDNRYLHRELHRISGNEIVGEDFGLKGVMEMVRQVAPLDSNVLLLGETGVGKEVVTNAIHYLSPRRNGPLIKVNCGAIPEGLIDSELFGHEKGSFTGATAMRRGRFERAHTGTLFLDEVAELPPAAQVRLLRILQERRIERVGGAKPVPVDVRVIAATHRNLAARVEAGGFREDLWYRINVFPITIPPLRHRKADIPAFVYHFIDRKVRELNLTHRPSPAPGAVERLQRYDWPGNVRELENAVERELIRNQAVNPGGLLRFDDAAAPVSAPPPLTRGSIEPGDAALELDEAVRRHVARVLGITGGKVQGPKGAAALLGLNPSTLRHRMRKLGIPFGRGGK
ncbi:sigma-54 interaction domain-containing protein [Desulfococcus sp.]|uniref:sigma-54 interaction domain-containing protein n=1 Tax=Desulfococcus sp. TaxID=2025834 RepID=UPI003593E3C6